MHKRYMSATVCLGIASLFAVVLLLVGNRQASTADVPSPVMSASRVSVRPEVSLQVTEPLTVYLPAVTKYYPPPLGVFGVEMSAVRDASGLQEALASGAQWVRLSVFPWDLIESNRTLPPQYDWSVVDEESLINAAANGFEVIAAVKYAPDWAQAYLGSYCGPIAEERFGEFAQFLTALVARYKKYPYNVKYWELGNEPDAPLRLDRTVWGCWGIAHDPYYGGMHYGKMLQYAYPAIKAADPEAQVLIGGLLLDCDPEHPPPGKDCAAGRFLEGILEAAGGSYFDVLNFHAYSYYGGTIGDMTNPNWAGSSTGVAEKVAFLRRVLGDYGYAEKPLMNTEAALLCPEDTGDCRETQALYVSKAYADAIRLGLRAQVYYAMTGSWRHSALLGAALTPKPVYYAYQAAASFLNGATFVGPVGDYPASVVGYAFRRPGSGATVDLVWLSDGSSLYVSLPGGASAYDQYGNFVTSSGAVALGYAPIYIVRP